MKPKFLHSLLVCYFVFHFNLIAQSRQTYNSPQSNYVRPDLNALNAAMQAIQQRHDNVRAYKDNIQDWIYKLRKADPQNQLKTKLDFYQSELDKLESRGDWANLENEVRQIENGIKRTVSDYEEE